MRPKDTEMASGECAEESATPRTDALFSRHVKEAHMGVMSPTSPLEQVTELLEHARQLETELTQSIEDVRELVVALRDCVENLSHLEDSLRVRVNPPTLDNARALLAKHRSKA